jgi:hypothetical protein
MLNYSFVVQLKLQQIWKFKLDKKSVSETWLQEKIIVTKTQLPEKSVH